MSCGVDISKSCPSRCAAAPSRSRGASAACSGQRSSSRWKSRVKSQRKSTSSPTLLRHDWRITSHRDAVLRGNLDADFPGRTQLLTGGKRALPHGRTLRLKYGDASVTLRLDQGITGRRQLRLLTGSPQASRTRRNNFELPRFGFVPDRRIPPLLPSMRRGDWRQAIRSAQSCGFRIMARPHASCRLAQESLEPRTTHRNRLGRRKPVRANGRMAADGRFDPFATSSGMAAICAFRLSTTASFGQLKSP